MGFKQHKKADYTEIANETLKLWKEKNIFPRSVEEKKSHPKSKGEFVFYEGPPSANGKPGIHHVLGRTIKDVFCRYKSLDGYSVPRRAGWDTHGLPVELGVEKELGIKKDDIGVKISVEDYNAKCKEVVMRYKSVWEDLTEKMGYWVDLEKPYITYDSKYMETVWWLLGDLHKKGLLYKGHTIQPYSPMAGTGLSSHELNQPGCYRDVQDQTVVAQFIATSDAKQKLLSDKNAPLYFLAWTTTPWTLPANTALCVGPKIDYALVETYNKYSKEKVNVVLAKARLSAYFKQEVSSKEELDALDEKGRTSSYVLLKELKGADLKGLTYKQLFDIAKPEGKAFEILNDGFVTTEDGTGIVHMAPCYGADDARICKSAGISSLDIVGFDGTYKEIMGKYSGEAVKADYLPEEETKKEGFKSLDVKLVIDLKERNQAFHAEKYLHSYPHCWRTDKPVLYFPLESWFIKTTAMKDRLIELNKTINWQPESTGTGRFGNWLENLVDWNLSRSRFWGIPLPIWRNEDTGEEIIISSIGQLKSEIDKSIKAGLMKENFLADFEEGNMSSENYSLADIHRTNVDKVVLVSETGTPLHREDDIIDVWFDSGAMPYAQIHYPFENKDELQNVFPADFIAEGVDQTRGWFFTLHAIATLCFDSVAYKNVVSNGLVLDKNGQKMSKRLGNGVEPFEALEKYGPDTIRWYMMSNAQPWDNLRFDPAGVEEVKRKFFGTLFNTYSFFALYSNLDNFNSEMKEVPVANRRPLDRWILSELHSTVKEAREHFEDYNPTKAARIIQDFTTERLSNWYVRLNRKRFWKGSLDEDKLSAYQTLYTCLETVAILMAPIAPMYSDMLYRDLKEGFGKDVKDSVHLDFYPVADESLIDEALQTQMRTAQDLTSLTLSLREKSNIRVRQPLSKILVPVVSDEQRAVVESAKEYVLSETNIKSLEILGTDSTVLVKQVKPNFKTLGKKLGKNMKAAVPVISSLPSEKLSILESGKNLEVEISGTNYELSPEDITISFTDVPGLLITAGYGHTVALDTDISEDLKLEGISRELINRIQNLRKDSNLEVTDRVKVEILETSEVKKAVELHGDYMAGETLSNSITLVPSLDGGTGVEFDEIKTAISLERV